MKFTVKHTLDIGADAFWKKLFFDAEYNRRLFLEALKFQEWQVLEEKDLGGGAIQRKVRQTPQVAVPSILKKVVGDSFYYTEEGRFDPERKRWSYRIVPSKLADKILTSGEFWVEPLGDKKVQRFCTVDLEIKIFGVGGAAESFVEKQTREIYDQAAAFTNRYIQEKGLS
jgi:hypothetical protein